MPSDLAYPGIHHRNVNKLTPHKAKCVTKFRNKIHHPFSSLEIKLYFVFYVFESFHTKNIKAITIKYLYRIIFIAERTLLT